MVNLALLSRFSTLSRSAGERVRLMKTTAWCHAGGPGGSWSSVMPRLAPLELTASRKHTHAIGRNTAFFWPTLLTPPPNNPRHPCPRPPRARLPANTRSLYPPLPPPPAHLFCLSYLSYPPASCRDRPAIPSHRARLNGVLPWRGCDCHFFALGHDCYNVL